MIKISTIFLSLLLVLCVPYAHAQTPTGSTTPSVTSSPTSISDSTQIEKIKDLVASRVAELKLVEKRGILGTVTQVTSTQITLTDSKNKKRIIDIDEITKFSSPESKTFGISDIERGDKLGIVGLLNKGTDHILARFVNAATALPVHFEGAVTEIDKRNYIVTAIDEKGEKLLISIETSTKTSSHTNDEGLIKSGFSKLAIGERIYASGFMDDTNDNQLNAARIIHFPELPLSENLQRQLDSEVAQLPSSSTTPTVSSKVTGSSEN